MSLQILCDDFLKVALCMSLITLRIWIISIIPLYVVRYAFIQYPQLHQIKSLPFCYVEVALLPKLSTGDSFISANFLKP